MAGEHKTCPEENSELKNISQAAYHVMHRESQDQIITPTALLPLL